MNHSTLFENLPEARQNSYSIRFSGISELAEELAQTRSPAKINNDIDSYLSGPLWPPNISPATFSRFAGIFENSVLQAQRRAAK